MKFFVQSVVISVLIFVAQPISADTFSAIGENLARLIAPSLREAESTGNYLISQGEQAGARLLSDVDDIVDDALREVATLQATATEDIERILKAAAKDIDRIRRSTEQTLLRTIKEAECAGVRTINEAERAIDGLPLISLDDRFIESPWGEIRSREPGLGVVLDPDLRRGIYIEHSFTNHGSFARAAQDFWFAELEHIRLDDDMYRVISVYENLSVILSSTICIYGEASHRYARLYVNNLAKIHAMNTCFNIK